MVNVDWHATCKNGMLTRLLGAATFPENVFADRPGCSGPTGRSATDPIEGKA